MLRDILFRGKRVSDGQWVTGFYVRADGNWHKHGIHKDWIICGASANGGWFALHNRYAVEKESVCQYTGLKDKNGKRIFEGDVVNVWREQRTIEQVDEFQKYKAVIEFGNPNHLYSWGWQLKMIDDAPFNPDILLWVDMEETGAFIEVIGNIHDNPELLEVDNG